MKAIVCRNFGSIEGLRLEHMPPVALAAGEVRVRVYACGINFPDILLVQGRYQDRPQPPFVPGGEIAGTVVEVGPDVQGIQIGEKVMATLFRGGLAEFVNAPANALQPIPVGMPFDIAAGFLGTYMTSYYALTQRGQLASGETLLVLGAAGGVGTAALQIGKALGARVIAAASTDEKLAHARDHGATALINYAREDLREAVRRLTGDRGADVIFDPVGGDMFDAASRCVNWNGRILVVGFASGRIPQFPLNLALLKGSSIVGVYYGRFCTEQPEQARAMIREVSGLYERGLLAPHIDRRFALADSIEALRHVQDRKALGKVIVALEPQGAA